jgi:GNAT superfamily N-acetyltransferase
MWVDSVSLEPHQNQETFIQMLGEEHLTRIAQFNSNNDELNDFLRKDALSYQKLHLGTTYLLLRKSDSKPLAYITLSMSALKLPEKKEEFILAGKRLGEYPKDFPNQLPALLLGKLATDKREEGKGAAGRLLDFAVHTALEQRKSIGCAFLVAQAYARPTVVGWYERKLFRRIIQKIEGRETVPLYLELGV